MAVPVRRLPSGGAAAPGGGGFHRPGRVGRDKARHEGGAQAKLGDELQTWGGHRHPSGPGGRCGQVCPESRGRGPHRGEPRRPLYPCGHEGHLPWLRLHGHGAGVGLFPVYGMQKPGGNPAPGTALPPALCGGALFGAGLPHRPVQAEDPRDGGLFRGGEESVRRGARPAEAGAPLPFSREAGLF